MCLARPACFPARAPRDSGRPRQRGRRGWAGMDGLALLDTWGEGVSFCLPGPWFSS